ncbi:MAG: hypothetical protein IJY12_00425 [Clostridia bacterium]|nr:hypothetical protein [Clostridia bacterium]
MKKLYRGISLWLSKRYAFHMFLAIAMALIAGTMGVFVRFQLLAVLSFAGFICLAFRLFTFKHGKIPFLVRDRAWNTMQISGKEKESLEDEYKSFSLKRATMAFMIAWITFLANFLLLFIERALNG